MIENLIKDLIKEYKDNSSLDIIFGSIIILYYEQRNNSSKFIEYLNKYKDTHIESLQKLFSNINIPILNKIEVKYNLYENIIAISKLNLLEYNYQNLSETYEQINIFKKQEAAFYTPNEYTNEIISECFENIENIENLKIFDPTCGTGNFLIDSIEYFKGKINLDNIIGYEFSLTSALLCYIRLLSLNIKGNINITVCDSIKTKWPDKITHILGNPPYLHNGSKSYRDSLERNNIKENYKILGVCEHLNYSLLWFYKSCQYISENKDTISYMIYPKSILSIFSIKHIDNFLEFHDVYINNIVNKEELFNGKVGVFTKFVKISSKNTKYEYNSINNIITHEQMYQYSSENKINDIRALNAKLNKEEVMFYLVHPADNVIIISKTITNNYKFEISYDRIEKHIRNVYVFKGLHIIPYLSEWFEIFFKEDAFIERYYNENYKSYKLKMLYFHNFPIEHNKIKFNFTYDEFIERYKQNKDEIMNEINSVVNNYFISEGYIEGTDKIEFLRKHYDKLRRSRYENIRGF